jgi:hypothetical protein
MSLAIEEAGGRTGRPALPGARALSRFLSRPWLAYTTLVLLELRVVWGAWNVKDVTQGDTCSYFITAVRWFNDFKVDIAWSPLYTAFFGSFLFLTPDPAQVVLWHRLVIVFAASILVLAVMRRLLPPALAWLVAAWWAVLPINFDTFYEVHLFSVLPVLLALLLLSRRSRWGRGAALAVLAASTVLVRNEMGVAAGLLGLALLVREWRAARRSELPLRRHAPRLLAAYGVPLGVAAGLCLLPTTGPSSSIRSLRII